MLKFTFVFVFFLIASKPKRLTADVKMTVLKTGLIMHTNESVRPTDKIIMDFILKFIKNKKKLCSETIDFVNTLSKIHIHQAFDKMCQMGQYSLWHVCCHVWCSTRICIDTDIIQCLC